MSNEAEKSIPADYDTYFLGIVQSCLRYACPLAAAFYVMFFAWDCLFNISWDLAIKTLSLRVTFATVMLTFGRIAPRIRSLSVLKWSNSGLYLLSFLILILILKLIPDGLIVGAPGLMMITMFACGFFCLPPLHAATVGALGTAAYAGVAYYAGLPWQRIVSGAVFFISAHIIGSGFLVLLDREFRKRHLLERSLELEKEQSESLLKEILPRYVIQRIRDGADSIAESILEVNVIFIDIVGFRSLSKRLAPKHLVEVLGRLFRSFDDRCEAYGVTKIKILGDAYMAVTGAPEPSSLSANAAVEFCMEALVSVKSVAKQTGIPIEVRIGIATGAVVSGVLSLKRPAYDLWGETVTLASQLEATSSPGRIHIAETTFWRIKDRFTCEPGGAIGGTGLGPVQTYFVMPKPSSVGSDSPKKADLVAAHGRDSQYTGSDEPHESIEQSAPDQGEHKKSNAVRIAAQSMTATVGVSALTQSAQKRHKHIQELFLDAVALDPAKRTAFLQNACAGDADLLARVTELIQADAGASSAPVNQAKNEVIPMFGPGKNIASRFRVVRFIAAGGMADVYEVEDLQLHERVAMKTIRPEVLSHGTAVVRFKREVQYAKRVTHPCVCRIHDFGTHLEGSSEIVFLTMQLLNGETLAACLRRSDRIGQDAALPLIINMASALQAAHEAGIIHRDFKPSNVVLTDSPGGKRCVVTDFGLARSRFPDDDSSLTEVGKIVGTLTYMAPEQLTNGKITPATDVYALGLVMYEMLTGHRPFEGSTPMDMAAKRMSGAQPKSPSEYVPDLSARWSRMIMSCLHREPLNRPQRPEEIVSGLR